MGSYMTNLKHGKGRMYRDLDMTKLPPDIPEEPKKILQSLKNKEGIINTPYPDITSRSIPSVLHEYGHYISQNESPLSGNISRLHRVVGRVKEGEQNLLSWFGKRKPAHEIQTPRLDSVLDRLGLLEEKNAWEKGEKILRKYNPTQDELDYFNKSKELAIESYKRSNEVRRYGRKYNRLRDRYSTQKASEILGKHRSPWGTHNYELPPSNI